MCCGTKRLTEIHCPDDCPYLSSAREHPPAIEQRQQQRDMAVLLPTLHGLSEVQMRLFFLSASIAGRFKTDDLQRLLDDDLADAAGSLAATFETAERGVIYDHRPQSLVGQRLWQEWRTMLAEVGKNGGSRFERDAAAALRAIEKGAKAKSADQSATAYLELVKRVIAPAPSMSHAESDDRDAKAEGSGLILPGA